MAATTTDLNKNVEYRSDGVRYLADFDVVNHIVSLKTLAGEIVIADMTKHDLEHILAIITKLKADADALFV
jgi:hypothetical protein